MAVELAAAFISLVPSFRGGAGKIAEELGGPAERAGRDAGQRAGKGASESFQDKFSSGVKAVVGAAAVWGGGKLLANGFELAMAQADLPGRLSAQFGLAAPAAASAAKIAGDLYAQGWGESLAQIGQATGTVSRALQQLGTGEDIGRLTTQAQALSDTLGQDLSQTILSAQKLVQAGLAPSMEAAFDVIAGGFQKIPEAADDGLDTITEYAVQFQALGVDATTAFGLISQATQNGARDTDFVADTLKEFVLQVQGLDKGTSEAFKKIGLNGEKMQRMIAAGGPEAAKALQLTLDKLRAYGPQVDRAALSTELFGPKAEDLQAALLALDPSKAAAEMGNLSGAAQNLTDTVGGGLQSQLDSVSRSLDTAVAGALTTVLPLLQGLLTAIGPLAPVLGPVAVALAAATAATWLWNAGLGAVLKTGTKVLLFLGRMAIQLVVLTARVLLAAGAFAVQMGAALASATASLARYLAAQTVAVARTVAGWILMGTQALIQAARMALAWLIALGPIAVVIAAVVGLVALIIANWDAIVNAIVTAWNFVAEVTSTIWNAITGAISAVLSTIGGIFSGAWDGIMSGVRAALDWIRDRWNDFSSALSKIVDGIKSFLGSMWDGLTEGAKAVVNGAITIINGLIKGANFAIRGLNLIPGVNIPQIPEIPKLAQGGIADRPTLALIGEGRESEAVMPLSKLDGLLADQSGPTVVINAAGLDRHLAAWLRQAVRVQGGNVQAAFGRT